MLKIAVLAISLLAAGAQGAPRLETTGPLTDTSAPESVRSALEPAGQRVLLSEGPWCQVWLRRNIPQDKNPTSGALQPSLGVSTAVGVIRFFGAATDFRGQAIRAGIYTLRYAPIPIDGNHMGASEYPDFLLVIPVADDPDLGARFKFGELVRLSAKSTGTRHPGVLSVTPASGPNLPAVSTNEAGHVVVQMKAGVGAAGSPIAFVVKGHVQP